jgi:hypothetical protein
MSRSELLLQVLTMAGSVRWGEENELDRSILFGIAEEQLTRDIHDALEHVNGVPGFHDECKLNYHWFKKTFNNIIGLTKALEGEFQHAN